MMRVLKNQCLFLLPKIKKGGFAFMKTYPEFDRWYLESRM